MKSLKVFTLVSFLSVAVALSAQQDKPWEKISTPKLHNFKPQQPKRIELKNGIVIFLQEDHELPFVSGSITVPEGERDVPPQKAGLVGLYGEAWRTSGTEKMSGDQMDDLLESKAAHIETGGDIDSTSVSWDSLKTDTDQVMNLALDLFFHPRFNEDKLTLAQQQAATGIMRRNDDEDGIASRESIKLVYGKDSIYTHQPELATIGSISVGDFKAWHDRTIQGKLLISICGDFDSATMEAKLRVIFEPLPPTKSLSAIAEMYPPANSGVSFINKDDVNQSNIQIVAMGTDKRNPDVPALAVMNEILGGGFASRLFQKVRTELGLAYSVGGGYGSSYDHPGIFRVEVLTKSASTVDATQAALGEIQGLITRPVTEEEVQRAKDNILSSYLFRYDTRAKVLAASMRLEYYHYPADYLETYQAAIEKITAADVNRVAKKYIHPEKLSILVVGNSPEIKPGLDELKRGAVMPVDIAIPQPQDSK